MLHSLPDSFFDLRSVVSCRLFLRLKKKGNRISRIKTFPEIYQESHSPPTSKSSLAGSHSEHDCEKNAARPETHQVTIASVRQLTSNTFSIQMGEANDQAIEQASHQRSNSLHQWQTRTRRSESEPPRSGASKAFFTLPLHRSYARDKPLQEGVKLYQEVLQGQ